MRRTLWWIPVLGLILAACLPRPQSATETPPATLIPTITPSPVPASATPPPAATPTELATAEPTATQASLFAPVTKEDWQHGPADAAVTITEYGDYQ